MVTPTISRKLRTNDPPTNEEAAAVRKATEWSLNKLKIIENVTARLQDRLIVLCQKRKEIERFVEIHKGLLSPVRRLHRDILQEVFYQCLPIAHNSVFDPDAAPLVLGRVCSSWRQIAYTTPKLWSSLHIVVVPSSPYSARARFNAMSAWLSLSGALPLSISMSVSGFQMQIRERYVSIKSQVSSCMNLILTHVKRWKRIHLSPLPYDWARFFQLVNASDLPLLEVLHLEGDPVRTRSPMSLDISSFSRKGGILFSPLLHVLSLPEFSRQLLELPVQWRQTTALNLARSSTLPPFEDIIKVLNLCSDLQTCSITISTPNQQSLHATSTMSPIFLPNLRTLKVRGKSGLIDNLLIFIDKLFTPRLQHFAYERRVSVRTRPFLPESLALEPSRLMKSFCSFFQRLNEPLEEFDYWSNSLTRRGLMEVLSCLPGLKRLSLKEFSVFSMSSTEIEEFDDRFLAQFIPHEHRMRYLFDDDFEEGEDGDKVEENRFPTSICLCPKLEVLNSIEAVYSERILLEFLRSRSACHLEYDVSRLRRASISFKDIAKPDTMGQVKDMTKQLERLEKDTGLVVKLRYPEIPLGPLTPLLYDDQSPFNGIHRIQAAPMLMSGTNLGYIKFNLWNTPIFCNF